ncbi:MAG: arsenate reductase (glutaredoxin) [Planctomycetota bacterium]|jgi:arsenate reductase|nr:arsenate reductase (glutaredoxin) [Planctomycetota bacterium]
MEIVAWLNLACSKCRALKAILEERGLDAELRYYLENPPKADEISELLVALGESDPVVLIRQKEHLWIELALAEASAEEKIQAIVKHPELFNRPVLVVNGKAVVARPVDLALPLLGSS